MNSETIQLEFTVDEANILLAALGEQPYIKVADLIQKIQKQATSQFKPAATNDHRENVEASQILVEDEQ